MAQALSGAEDFAIGNGAWLGSLKVGSCFPTHSAMKLRNGMGHPWFWAWGEVICTVLFAMRAFRHRIGEFLIV
jgi:hypothetical protein